MKTATILSIYIKHIKFSMRFRTYIMVAAASLWFVFGSLFMYRSTWDFEDSKKYKNAIIEFGVKEFDQYRHRNALTFKLAGLDQQFGIYKRKRKNYTELVSKLKIGDTVTIYYSDWKQNKKKTNLQVIHFETKNHVLVNYTDRKYRDRKIAWILYSISFIFGIAAWYLNKKRLPSKKSE